MSVTYCLSDLHLCDTFTDGCLFTRAKEAVFCQLVDTLLAQDGMLVCAGDVFDLTGSVLPRAGLEAFFEVTYQGGWQAAQAAGHLPAHRERPVGERIHALGVAFPDFFAALSLLAQKDRLRFIPGNHDWEAFTAQGWSALQDLLEAQNLAPPAPHVWAGEACVSAHGHEFDELNRTVQEHPEGWRNPGSVLTSVLYHALVPALRSHGVPQHRLEAIPAIRPAENIVSSLQKLPLFAAHPDLLKRWLRAFVELLDANGYPIPWYARLFSFLITVDHVRSCLRDDAGLDEVLAEEAAAITRGRSRSLALERTPTLLVMGHTHDIDGANGYVNLGTWIDHCTRMDGARDLRLPFLRISAQGHAALYDAKEFLVDPEVRPIWAHR